MSLQKANFWKRIAAFIFDFILAITLATGVAAGMSALLKYDSYWNKLEDHRARYEEEYNVDFDITEEEEAALTEEEKAAYEAATEAFNSDEEVNRLFNMMFMMTLMIGSISILTSDIVFFLVFPLIFKNGQTVGKKVFGLGVMRTNGTKLTNPILFVRSILGLYAIETMVPVALFILIFFGVLGIVGVITFGLLVLLEIIVMIVTKTNSSIHDLLSDTVVIDLATQRIFNTQDELIAYEQKLEAQANENPEELPKKCFTAVADKGNNTENNNSDKD